LLVYFIQAKKAYSMSSKQSIKVTLLCSSSVSIFHIIEFHLLHWVSSGIEHETKPQSTFTPSLLFNLRKKQDGSKKGSHFSFLFVQNFLRKEEWYDVRRSLHVYLHAGWFWQHCDCLSLLTNIVLLQFDRCLICNANAMYPKHCTATKYAYCKQVI
jgi:hypothetical protein